MPELPKIPKVDVEFFPGSGGENRRVKLKGEANALLGMMQELETLVDLIENSFERIIQLPNDAHRGYMEYVKFVVGEKKSRLKDLQNNYDVEVKLPVASDKDEVIVFTGKKEEDVVAVEYIIMDWIASLNLTVDLTIPVPKECHRTFLNNNAQILKEIERKNGNCRIKIIEEEKRAQIRGRPEDANNARERLDFIINDLMKRSIPPKQSPLPRFAPLEASQIRALVSYDETLKEKVEHNCSTWEWAHTVTILSQISGQLEITGNQKAVHHAKQVIEKEIQQFQVERYLPLDTKQRALLIGNKGGVYKRLINTFKGMQLIVPQEKFKDGNVRIIGPYMEVMECIGEINYILELGTQKWF